ncbi:hypothetical protein [Marinibactrum halimedae]|uniref:DUF3857 domain-containing protein n=1 Tax=Marinibactrum halimedae TaxID=1444977 RepID=A0AA37WL10_9GAMM|nr:hypothetical protein [Marinibactrum halimedae]MCD9459109.1 hypothetical protein [Marinibactrum halimedae]GLS24710.1 hypothetical protein GCM10007877_04240 [Marinibactrum halimedae]
MNKLTAFLLFILSGTVFASESYVVNTSHILYVTKSEDIRAFIEPGTVLKKVKIPTEDSYKRRIRVITPGGLEGEVSRWGYDEHNEIQRDVAYLKRPLRFKKETFHSGDKFMTSVIDDEDGIRVEVVYPQPFLSLRDNAYYVRTRTQTMTETEFEYHFNLVSPGPVNTKFPTWARTRTPPVEWGCENSKTEESVIEVGGGAKVSAKGGFFKFFEADAYVNNDNKKTITYTKELTDKNNRHKITYWGLKSSTKPSTPILDLALEKLSPCDSTKKLQFSYVIHFPKHEHIDPIIINRDWVKGKLKEGGTSPIALNTLDDYRALKFAFQDFKFELTRQGYDLNSALLQYVMMITANIQTNVETNKNLLVNSPISQTQHSPN